MKKIKSLVLLTMLSGAVLISSCKKDKTKPTATITATIDGTATNFNTHAVAVKGSGETAGFTVIGGQGPNGATLSISVYGTPTAGKTYVSGGDNPDNEPLVEYSESSTSDDDFLNDDDDTANLVTVTITSVTSNSIQGTFKGKLTDVVIGNVAPKTKLITNGQFSVSY